MFVRGPSCRRVLSRKRGAAMAIIFANCWAMSAHGENWPGWRGPDRNGVTADRGAPVNWSATSGVRWKASLPGSGISNPIVWNDRVFSTSSDGARQQDLHVVSLNLASGKLLWHSRLWGTTPTLYHETKSSMASPSPITDGQRIYAFFGTGDVFCLDFEGRLLWHRSLAAEYGAFENRFAASSSPLLFADSLIVQCDHYGASYVIAIDKLTGANRWKTDRPEVWLSWSSPICVRAQQSAECELILCGSEKIDAFNPRTGGKLWTFGGMARECIPTPVTGHGLLVAVSGPNGTSYAIRLGGRGDITASHVVWSSTRGNPFVPSAILVGDYYYLVDDHGIGSCLDARTGKQIWRKRFGGDFTASPVSADNRIYFVNEAGTTLVIAVGTEQYQELARNALDEPVFASPAISGGNLLIRTAGRLWCFGGDAQADSRP